MECRQRRRLRVVAAHVASQRPDALSALLDDVAELRRQRSAQSELLAATQARLGEANGALAALSEEGGRRDGGRLLPAARLVATELEALRSLDRRAADATERLAEQAAAHAQRPQLREGTAQIHRFRHGLSSDEVEREILQRAREMRQLRAGGPVGAFR